MEEIYKDGYLYKDVYTIIEMMEDDLKEQINPKFIKFLKENQDEGYISQIDSSTPLKNQSLRREVRLLLSIMYMHYFCDEEKKKELLEHEKKMLEEYNSSVNMIFKKEENDFYNSKQEERSLLVISDESFIKKIINKIIQFFK